MLSKKVLLTDNKVSETLLIPLYARAREQRQAPPLLRDAHAARLVEAIDYDFSKFELAPMSMTGVVIRASYFDAVVRQFVANHEQPVVVHLGYGLDTRVQRLGRAVEGAHFYHVDVAQVIALRQQLLPAEANENYLSTSMFTTEWMDQLVSQHPKATFLFVIEGVLMYFSYEQNQQLFHDLATRFPGAELHFDVINSWLSSHTYLHDAVRFTKASFQFGLDDDKEFEQWHPRLQCQGSFNLLGFDGWQRMSWPVVLGQALFPVLRSTTRVVAYLITDE